MQPQRALGGRARARFVLHPLRDLVALVLERLGVVVDRVAQLLRGVVARGLLLLELVEQASFPVFLNVKVKQEPSNSKSKHLRSSTV